MRLFVSFIALLGLMTALTARAEKPMKFGPQDIGLQETVGQSINLDTQFVDESGKSVALRQYFNEDTPVILSVVYYGCPNLCTLVLNGMVEAFKGLDPKSDHFRVVSVSIDPQETPALASKKKVSYLEPLGEKFAGGNWIFLTGSPESVKTLTQELGFRYVYDASSKQFVHAAGIYVISPQGVIRRILYGSHYQPRDVKWALIEAGGSGSFFDKMMLALHRYDVPTREYRLKWSH